MIIEQRDEPSNFPGQPTLAFSLLSAEINGIPLRYLAIVAFCNAHTISSTVGSGSPESDMAGLGRSCQH